MHRGSKQSSLMVKVISKAKRKEGVCAQMEINDIWLMRERAREEGVD